ncbi:protein translocase subunit SecD [Fusibacter sp. JL298sf-3]
MNGKNTLLFFLIVAVIAGAAFIAINGLTVGNFSISPVKDQMKLGLDVKGGVAVVYEAQTDETGDDLKKTMEQTKSVIGKRVDEMGLTEPVVTIQGENRISIELPGVENAEQAAAAIGQTALLEFGLVKQGAFATAGMKTSDFEYEHVLYGQNVKDAFVTQDENGLPAIALRFDAEGTDKFSEATKKATSFEGGTGQIAIILDGEVVSAPTTSIVIPDGKAVITGRFTFEEALQTSQLIRGGALPVELVEVKSSVIGPTLGLNSLYSAIRAALIGLSLVVVFMIIFYRIPGVIATIALTLYALIMVYALIALNATLTLPGVAGIVLSLGMAVDANVIIFERLKEEIAVGKSLRASIDSGFHRAMRTIIDSNVTTLIAAVILFYFGEGPIKGFAVTLMVGIAASMFTAVVATKTLLKLSLGFSDRKKLYGSRG